ncbi:uncharacterized protein DFL_007029 [Arthrobotrys flagrans]|uniref:Uncharacterized protein n=1 Tax=Arthrobotrys flagrans TaxID=97331 RepID=A0A436ZUG5_ARTFL|nr:hypothetical protein DFL_007029 [Arthrobotrys flagrans]
MATCMSFEPTGNPRRRPVTTINTPSLQKTASITHRFTIPELHSTIAQSVLLEPYRPIGLRSYSVREEPYLVLAYLSRV